MTKINNNQAEKPHWITAKNEWREFHPISMGYPKALSVLLSFNGDTKSRSVSELIINLNNTEIIS